MRLAWAERARIGAAAAALCLALLSRGDAVALALALAACLWRTSSGLAAVLALGATSWRWGSSALASWAGGQAVLGPAGWLEPSSAAASAWLAGAALVLCAPVAGWRTVTDPLLGGGSLATVELPRRTLATTLAALAVGVAAADVVAGPSFSDRWWVRVSASAIGVGAALLAQAARRRWRALPDVVALVAAAGALACTVPSAPGWAGTVQGTEVRSGVVLALGVGVAAAVGTWVLAAMRQLRP